MRTLACIAMGVVAASSLMPSAAAAQQPSVACDLRITQLVDRKVGVHVMIPKSLF